MRFQHTIFIPILIVTLGLDVSSFNTLFAAESASLGDFAAKAVDILDARCGQCHHQDSEGGIDYVHDIKELIEKRKLVPGKLDQSRIWIRINDVHDPMPPEGSDEGLTENEKDILREFILRLAEPGTNPDSANADSESPQIPPSIIDAANDGSRAKPEPVTTAHVIDRIHAYLQRLDPRDRRHQRFIVLSHLHNAGLDLPESESDWEAHNDYLSLVRAAVSKTLNSLTWESTIVVPQTIDQQQTVMAFDLRDVQWDMQARTGRPALWNLLVQDYPYALKYDRSSDELSSKSDQIAQWTGADIASIRADWFVANATQPQYYHTLLFDAVFENIRSRRPVDAVFADNKSRLEQPMNQDDLMEWLRVDIQSNLLRGRARRAAFTRSGVSSQPRMLERHPAIYGYLWSSYDFKRGSRFMNLNARPLGPDGVFDSKRFDRVTFRHDGGELIFGLPNGLHGYLLVDAEGKRIASGPPDIVEDRAKTLGNGIIVNGLSCIACHKNGLIEDFQDEVRFGISGLDQESRRITRKLFVDRADLDPLIQQDQARYRQAAIAAMEDFLPSEAVQSMRDGGRLIEPVGPVAKRFLVDTLSAADIASELGVPMKQLVGAIKYDRTLQRLGLMAVAEGGKISREIWESGAGTSMFQKTAQALDLGTPTGIIAQHWRGK